MSLESYVVCDRCRVAADTVRDVQPVRAGFTRIDFTTSVLMDGLGFDESLHLCKGCLDLLNTWFADGRGESSADED